MTVILFATIVFGVGLGFIQGMMDPENHKSTWRFVLKFERELEYSEVLGIYVGAFCGMVIEYIRQLETRHRKPLNIKKSLEEQLGQHANSQNLDFSDDEDENSQSWAIFSY